jgi:NADPH:quinone reductase-like Zn-dependent oxidoreductase
MKIPQTMKAAAIDRFGPPSVLRLHTLPVPTPGPREILLAIHTAGVGGWDESIRDGSWRTSPGRPRFPLVLGTDGAGTVVVAGARVRRFRVGDRAYAYAADGTTGGFYAEFVAVDERKAGLVPRQLDLRAAGAGAVTALTALQGVDGTLRVRKGETVLIFGATGAVGTLAVQFARARGARVIATGTGRRAATLLRRLGAAAVVDARKDDFAERIRESAPDGIDAAFALAGGKELERGLDFVRDRGRIVYPNGVEPEPEKRRGFRVRSYDVAAGPREFTQLAQAIARARLRVPIAASYSLAQAATAHRRLGDHLFGRIALRVRR